MAVDLKMRDEAEMIASIVAGDTQLYHELIRPYERRVYMMALSFLKNEADAEDAAQEAFLSAFRNLASFRAEAKFSTWLVTIALNEARNRLRRRSTMPLESLEEMTEDAEPATPTLLRDWREIPSEALERKEVREIVQAAIATLPDIYRNIVMLRDIEGLNVAEAAAVLSISTAAVKIRLHRARMMLQRQLAPQLKAITPKKRWLPWL